MDIEGNKYYDCLSGYSAVNQGHNHPDIKQAMKDFIDEDFLPLTSRAFRHGFFNAFLKEATTFSGTEMLLPMNTGAEAVETTIKLARLWGYEVKGIPINQAKIGVCEGNFHGRTTTIVGMSDDPVARGKFGPFTPGFEILPYGNLKALENFLKDPTVAAILLEPIQGEAGVIVPPEGYLAGVRELTTKKDVLFIADEIQTGFGRTGKDFACQHENVIPDLYAVGKALSGGFYPISGVLGSSELLSLFTPGSHGSTYGGNPLASLIGTAALRVIKDEKLSEQSAEKGEYLKNKFKDTFRDVDGIKEIRGKGLMVAIEFEKEIAHPVVEALVSYGILAKDTHSTTIRFTPPLVTTKDQLDDIVDRVGMVVNKNLYRNIEQYMH